MAPWAFTEHGALMAANILRSERAVQMSVFVVRAFVRLRETIAGNRELEQKLDALERHVQQRLTTHDQAIVGILKAIRELMTPPEASKRPIGFVTKK